MPDDFPKRLEVLTTGVPAHPGIAAGTKLPAAEQTSGLLDYVALIWKFKFTMAAALLLCLAAAVFSTFSKKPAFRAYLQLEVEELNQNFMNARDVDPGAGTNPVAPDSYVQTQVEVMKSQAVLERVVKRLKLDENPGYIAQSETPMQRIAEKLHVESLLARLPQPRYALILRTAIGLPPPDARSAHARALEVAASNLQVKGASQSSLVQLYYTAPDRETPALFLNTLAEEFVAQTMEVRWAGTQRTSDWLSGHLRMLKQNLETSEKRLQDYAHRTGVLYTDDRATVAEDKLRQLQEEWLRAQADRTALEGKYEQLRVTPPDRLPDAADDLLLRDYNTRLADLERDRNMMLATMTPEHSKIRKLTSEVEGIRTLIREEQQNLIGRIRNRYEAAQKRESLLEHAYEAQFKIVAGQSESAIPMNVLKREVESQRQFYEEMLRKVNSAGVATAIRASNIHVVNAATPPVLPYKPDLLLNLGLGLAAGLVLGAFLCFLREAIEIRYQKVRAPGDSAQYLRLAELGVIPAMDSPGAPRRQALQLQLASSTPAERWRCGPASFNDSFFATLDSLRFGTEQAGMPKIVLITSALPGEGKSSVTGFLGLALAEMGKRVLLIDADLRNPSLHTSFAIANETGLSNYLESAGPSGNHPVLATVSERLQVLSSGSPSDQAARLFGSQRLPELLGKLREQFDVIIIDSAPVLLFPDARMLGRLADGVVMVVRSNRNPLRLNQDAADTLRQAGSKLLGTLLNDWRPDSSADYLRRYGQYAAY